MGQQHKMLVLSLVTILASSCISIPSRQRYTSFKNFPVVGIKENHEEESPIETVEEAVYTDSLDDVFVEEAVYLTPEDREQRAIDNDDSDVSYVELDNFEYADESLVEEENERPERDGTHGSHGSSRHSANRN